MKDENVNADLLEINSIWNKFDEANLAVEPPPKLWHYTASSAAVNGIIKKNEIWYSPYNDLNDPSEINYGLELAIDFAKNEKKKFTKINEISAYENLIEALSHHKQQTNPELYFLCFTEAGNEDVSQWRAYGGDGEGYCLEFSKNTIFFDRNNIENAMFPIRAILEVRKIVYEPIDQGRLLKTFMGLFHNFIISGAPYQLLLTVLFLRQLSAHFKHRSYKPEKEWRSIILTDFSGKLFQSSGKIETIEIGGQFRKKAILDLPAQKEPLDGICQLTCGPKQNDSKVSATRQFVDIQQIKSSHKVIVDHSKIPMR